jgi:hypothetical protein
VPLEILDKRRPQTVQKGISAQFRPKHDRGVEKCDWNEWLMWKWLERWESAVRDIAKADAPAAKRQTNAVPGKAGDVPREHATLHNYLTNRYADIVVLTFDQIEGFLGFRLPDAARTQEEWWTGTYRDGDERLCSDAWILAGMMARPNLLTQTVVFECEKST